MTFNNKGIKAFAVCICLMFTAFAMCSCNILSELAEALEEPVSQTETQASAVPDEDREPVETSYGFESLSDRSLEELYYFIDDYAVNNRLSVEAKIAGEFTERQIYQALSAYKNDHPEKFWLKNVFSYYVQDNETYIYLFYTMTLVELDTAKKEFDSIVDRIVAQAPKNASDFELEKYVNDYLTDNCEYDYGAVARDEIIANENDAYGALVDKKAVCEGYARAFQLICNKLGLECVNIAGKSENEGHQWNCISIEDEWYYIDVTWNDSDEEAEFMEYNYFNLTEEQLEKTHKTDPLFSSVTDEDFDTSLYYYNTFVPECTSDKYNYYKYTCITVDDIYNSDEIKESIAKSAKNGDKYYSFVISDELDYEYTAEEIINNGYLYEWIEGANYLNGNEPQLNPSCYVYKNEAHNVINIEFEYINQ